MQNKPAKELYHIYLWTKQMIYKFNMRLSK